MDEFIGAQKRILEWAQCEPFVLALFWYGSYSIGCSKADSDLDVAVLFKTETSPSWLSLERAMGNVCMKIGTTSTGGRVTYFLGEALRRVDVSWANREEGLAWLSDCPEVPEPRLVLAFERNGAGQGLVARAAKRLTLDLPRRANEEIEKFVEAFEAASRAHNRSDAYSFYFQYNLALHRLARLVAISRKGPPRLYLIPQLTNTLLTEAERGPFIALNAPMDLKQGNQAKLLLQEKFIEFLRELSGDPFRLSIDIEGLRNFLDAVRIRDAMYNVRDVGVWLGHPLRPGRLFRASVLSRWQDEPFLKQWLQANRIGRIIDLREDKESEGPTYKPETLIGIDYRRFPLKQGSRIYPDKPKKERRYSSWLDSHPQTFINALRSLDADAPPVAVHCKAGMDRTGIFVALLGLLLGVEENQILADYEASGVTVSRKWMEQFCNEIRIRGGVHSVLGVHGWTTADTARLRFFFENSCVTT